MVKAITSNRKTSVLGVIAIVIAVGELLYAILDGDPATVPDFDTVFNMLGFGAAGIGLLMASDGEKNETNFKSNRSVGGIR